MAFSQEIKKELSKIEQKNLCCKNVIENGMSYKTVQLENECCIKTFLLFMFVHFGASSEPEKEYRLEFLLPEKELAEKIMSLINSQTPVNAKLQERWNNYVVYIKGAQAVEDILTFMGASNSSMELMQVKMYKEVKNNINRQANFQTANIDKSLSASAKQTIAIAIISDTIGIDALDDRLKQLAIIRLENPQASLKELSQILNISRSGVNHRMNEILEISQKCKESEK